MTKLEGNMTISIIIGSIRRGRFSEKPAQWILQQLRKRERIEAFSISETSRCLSSISPPSRPCRAARPTNMRWWKKWTAQIAASDGFICHTALQLRPLRGAEKRDRLQVGSVRTARGARNVPWAADVVTRLSLLNCR